jgi:hypothetical protein
MKTKSSEMYKRFLGVTRFKQAFSDSEFCQC